MSFDPHDSTFAHYVRHYADPRRLTCNYQPHPNQECGRPARWVPCIWLNPSHETLGPTEKMLLMGAFVCNFHEQQLDETTYLNSLPPQVWVLACQVYRSRGHNADPSRTRSEVEWIKIPGQG